MWPVVWLIVALVTATSLPSNRLASKNAISACESNYVNLVTLVNLVTSLATICAVYLKNQPVFSTVTLELYLPVLN